MSLGPAALRYAILCPTLPCLAPSIDTYPPPPHNADTDAQYGPNSRASTYHHQYEGWDQYYYEGMDGGREPQDPGQLALQHSQYWGGPLAGGHSVQSGAVGQDDVHRYLRPGDLLAGAGEAREPAGGAQHGERGDGDEQGGGEAAAAAAAEEALGVIGGYGDSEKEDEGEV